MSVARRKRSRFRAKTICSSFSLSLLSSLDWTNHSLASFIIRPKNGLREADLHDRKRSSLWASSCRSICFTELKLKLKEQTLGAGNEPKLVSSSSSFNDTFRVHFVA